jgi:hypothetical protein
MKKPARIEVIHLFPDLYAELIELLETISAVEWNYPTSNSKWNVKDIVAHLIDTDLRRLSYQRDKMIPPTPNNKIETTAQLVVYLDYLNSSWVNAAKRLSPNVLIDFLKYIKVEMPKLLSSLDMDSKGLFPVWWAGEEESKCWFDIAREYTEKWYHQQQIREALNKPLLNGQKWIHPLLDTFVRGLVPKVYSKSFPNKYDLSLQIEVKDILDGKWILKKNNSWELFVGEISDYTSKVVMTADTAWRMFTRNITSEAAKAKIVIYGDVDLGSLILELTTVIK